MAGESPPGGTVTVRGVEVPRIGLGTWQLTGDAGREAVSHALELGYRHLDTAAVYGNEEEVGRAVAESGVGREELWLTTKVSHTDIEPSSLRASTEASLSRLGLDFVDLLLIHWPGERRHFTSSLAEMVALREEGLIRELGVSNYPPGLLRRALEEAPVFCDQVEFHPHLEQPSLLSIAAEHDVLIAAYAPNGSGAVLRDPVLVEVAEAHGRTPAQVALRWLLDQDRVAVLPRSKSPEHRAANLDVDFELEDEERRRIDAAAGQRERLFDPEWAPDWEE